MCVCLCLCVGVCARTCAHHECACVYVYMCVHVLFTGWYTMYMSPSVCRKRSQKKQTDHVEIILHSGREPKQLIYKRGPYKEDVVQTD